MTINTYKLAIMLGWRPKMEKGAVVRIRPDAQVTWIPHLNTTIVPSNRGAVSLDEGDYFEATKFIEERSKVGKK